MLPNIDSMSTNASVSGAAGQTAQKRPETDRVVQAMSAKSVEAYKSGRSLPDPASAAERAYSDRRIDRTEQASPTEVRLKRDQAELNFSLSREERDAFINAFSNRQDPATMSEEEKESLQSAAERIAKYVEETISKNGERRERVEKAVGEWYSRMSKRELEGHYDLINLLRKAAAGQLDTMWD